MTRTNASAGRGASRAFRPLVIAGAVLPALLIGAGVVGAAPALAAAPAPTVEISVSGEPTASGWYTDWDTNIGFLATPSAGAAIDTVTMVLSGAQNQTHEWQGATSSGLGLTEPGVTDVVVTVRDTTGLEAIDTLRIKSDPVRPLIVPIGAPYTPKVGDSWMVDFACSDEHSGVASCEMLGHERGEIITFTEAGRREFTLRTTDHAGNQSGVQINIYVRSTDTTPPTLTVDVPPAQANGWHQGPVELGLSATDTEEGVQAFYIEDAEGIHIRPAETSVWQVTGDGHHQLGIRAGDTVGNVSPTQTFDIAIDATSPTIEIAGDAPTTASYTIGEQVPLDFSCADETSGVATCGGDVEPGADLPTDTAGHHTIALRATDVAGNEADRVLEYVVVEAGGPGGGDGGAGPDTGAGTGAGAGADHGPSSAGGTGAAGTPAAPRQALAATGAEPASALLSAAALGALGGALILVRRARVRAVRAEL